VNWSRHFISSCLKAAGVAADPSIILANELDGVAEGKPSTGQISSDVEMKIIASVDKLKHLEKMRKADAAPIVYVGDSWTDIECLLAADLGVSIRDKPMGSSQTKLTEALERLRVDCPQLSSSEETDGSQVVWARDFVEIQEWVDDHRARRA
jgi:hypothetical protein